MTWGITGCHAENWFMLVMEEEFTSRKLTNHESQKKVGEVRGEEEKWEGKGREEERENTTLSIANCPFYHCSRELEFWLIQHEQWADYTG